MSLPAYVALPVVMLPPCWILKVTEPSHQRQGVGCPRERFFYWHTFIWLYFHWLRSIFFHIFYHVKGSVIFHRVLCMKFNLTSFIYSFFSDSYWLLFFLVVQEKMHVKTSPYGGLFYVLSKFMISWFWYWNKLFFKGLLQNKNWICMEFCSESDISIFHPYGGTVWRLK